MSFLIFMVVLSSLALAKYPGENGPNDISFYQAPSGDTSLPLDVKGQPKNIIFLIGDGMGLSQVNAARMKAAGADGMLYLEHMPVIGLVRTHSFDHFITDSAASGTALATGQKTANGVVSQGPQGAKYKTILEVAQSMGKSTGLAVTSKMTHATPAVFGAHVAQRGQETEIAEQFIENRIDVLLGGGRQFFLPAGVPGSIRTDKRNLVKEAAEAGYACVDNKDALMKVERGKVLGLFQMEALNTVDPEPSLAEMTGKAIELLSKDKDGFFLMVEGSQIDWAGHANNIDYNIRQTLLFDLAVKEALEFAQKHKDTLVIVTADHECGGLMVTGGEMDGSQIETNWAVTGHTPLQVPLYAYGPGALNFAGVYDNTDIPKQMAELWKVKNFPRNLNPGEEEFSASGN
jgi:alkaline phosphatase